MLKRSPLPWINAVGCLILAGVLVAQWSHEHTLGQTINQLSSELQTAHEKAANDAKRMAALDRDIVVLKESIESTKKAADEAATGLAGRDAQIIALKAQVSAKNDQIKTWQNAIASRDAKLREQNTEMIAARAKLDSAISRLKAAGAR
jgi:chromosome segregation ATPase